MAKLSPFHLAIPVSDLNESKKFYEEILGCSPGRFSEEWADYDFFGHQLVIHLDPNHKANKHHNEVDGILVQLPLPKSFNEQKILDSITPEKDADGFHPINVGKLSISQKNDENLLIPCTPFGCLLLLKELNIDLVGKNAVVIGRSNIVGKPMAQLLIKESCTVTIVHSKTVDIEKICKKADILIAAIGKPELVNKILYFNI